MDKRMLVLRFPNNVTDKPIVCRLSRDFSLDFNILKAEIFPGREGLMVLELSGPKREMSKGLAYLKAQGVVITPVAREIRRNDDTCIQCGACTGMCPTQALSIESGTFRVLFDPRKCTACGMCLMICPVRAMEIRFAKEKILA